MALCKKCNISSVALIRQVWAQSGNYVANREISPTAIYFRNGRIVRLVDGALVVEQTAFLEAPDARGVFAAVLEQHAMKARVDELLKEVERGGETT